MKYIVFTHGGGRFANQFFTKLNLHALQIENSADVTCVSIPFISYDFFVAQNKLDRNFSIAALILKYILPHRFIRRKAGQILYHLLHRFAPASYACRVMYDPKIHAIKTNDVSLISLYQKNSSPLILAGWPLRCWDLVEKHADALRVHFIFKPKYQQPSNDLISRIKNDHFEKIIGIQIRQDDYKEFLEGRYFFSADTYLNFAQQAAKLFYPNQRVALLVTSDTPQENLASDLVIYLGPGAPMGSNHYICDLVALSQCDLIIAPPSTFAATASFFGQVPYLPLHDKDQIPNAQDILQNGLFDAIKDKRLSDIIA